MRYTTMGGWDESWITFFLSVVKEGYWVHTSPRYDGGRRMCDECHNYYILWWLGQAKTLNGVP